MKKFSIFLLDYNFFNEFEKTPLLSLLIKLVVKRDFDFSLTDADIASLKPYEFYSILFNKVLKLDRTDLKLIQEIQYAQEGKSYDFLYRNNIKVLPYLTQIYIHPCLRNLSLSKQQRRLISHQLSTSLILILAQGKVVECNKQFIQRHLKNGYYNPNSNTISIDLLNKDKDFHIHIGNEYFHQIDLNSFDGLKKILSCHLIDLNVKHNYKKLVPNNNLL